MCIRNICLRMSRGIIVRKMRVMAMMLLLVFLASSLQGCRPEGVAEQGQAEPTEIHIGVYEPMTCPLASFGEMTWEGIRLANEMYSEVLGKEVKLHLEDTKSDETESANAVSRLIDEKDVVAIIWSHGSGLSIAGGEVAKDKKIPVVGCSPAGPIATQDNPYYFLVSFTDPFQGRVMAKYAAEHLRAKTAVIIREAEDDYAVNLAKGFREAFIKLTGEDKSVLAEILYRAGDEDFAIQLAQMASLAPDVVFVSGNHVDSALLIQKARSRKITVPFLGGHTWDVSQFIEMGGVSVEGATFVTHYSAEAAETEANAAFVEAYKAKYGKDPSAFAALGHDAYLIILDAIERANSTEPEDLIYALADTKDFNGVTGIITMDEHGDAMKDPVILQVRNGRFEYVTTVPWATVP